MSSIINKIVFLVLLHFYITSTYSQNEFTEVFSIDYKSEHGITVSYDGPGITGISDFQFINDSIIFLCSDFEGCLKLYNINTKKFVESLPFGGEGGVKYIYDQNMFLSYGNGYIFKAYYKKPFKVEGLKINTDILSKIDIVSFDDDISIIAREEGRAVTYKIRVYNNFLQPAEQMKYKFQGYQIDKNRYFRSGATKNLYFINNADNTILKKIYLSDHDSYDNYFIGQYNEFIYLLIHYTTDPKNFKKAVLTYDANENKVIRKIELKKDFFKQFENPVKFYKNKLYYLHSTPDKAILYKIN